MHVHNYIVSEIGPLSQPCSAKPVTHATRPHAELEKEIYKFLTDGPTIYEAIAIY